METMSESCANCRFYRGAVVRSINEFEEVDESGHPLMKEYTSGDAGFTGCDTASLFRDNKESLSQRSNGWLLDTKEEIQKGRLELAIPLKYSKAMGVCRRNPPAIGTVIAESEFEGVGVAYSLFPVIGGHEWCGEYQPQRVEVVTI
jgi:hypothetical protein